MNRKIYFRADGSNQIGLGHLTRCLALARMLQSTFDIVFICIEINAELIAEIEKLSFQLIVIKNEDSFFQLLKPTDFVVLDHYLLGTDYQLKIKDIGCKLIAIDDLHEIFFHADLIINHAPNIKPTDYKAKYYTQFATGLDYVLLRPIFLRKTAYERSIKSKSSVFICFGGSDSKNLTQVVTEILKSDTRFDLINVVVGSAYCELGKLKESIANDDRFNLHVAIDAVDMAKLISISSLAIVPASGILQEVLALDTRAISGMYVENQRNIFENYKKLNAFVSAETFSESEIINAIDNAFDKVDEPSHQLIDGYSDERILKYFNQLLLEDAVKIRNVIEDDLHQTYNWANDISVRKFFFNSEPILFSEHQSWFKKKITNKECFYYIGLLDNQAFGSIRFDLQDNVATISYLIDPNYQGRGLGTIILKKGLDLLVEEVKDRVKIIKGEVLFGNVASIKIFQKLGYGTIIDHSAKVYKFEKLISR